MADLSIEAKQYFELARSREFWLALNPDYTISNRRKKVAPLALTTKQMALIREQLREEGYFKIDEVLPKDEMARLASLVANVKKENWASAFAFVYDESWELFYYLDDLMTQLLGKRYFVLPAFWAFFVEPGSTNTGWYPHRDRTRQVTVDKEGNSISLNVWIPVTDADPLNGCMYILPAHQDINYPNNLQNTGPSNLQDIRAIPAKAGSIIVWNEAVYHWGGRSSKYATHTRMAMALAFQNSASEPFEKPLLKALELPSFEERLSLIAYQMLRYQMQGHLSPVLKELSVALAELGPPLVVFDQGGPYYYDADGEHVGKRRVAK